MLPGRADNRTMLKRLHQDYWPKGTGRPIVRTVLGLLGGPAIAVPLALLAALLLDFSLSGDFNGSTRRVFQHGPELLVGTYMIALTMGGVAFLLLWSLRLRSKMAFLLAGFLVGVVAYLAVPLVISAAQTRPGVEIIVALSVVFGVYFAIVMLAVRWVAGVRNLGPEGQS